MAEKKVIQKVVRWPCGVCGRHIGNKSSKSFKKSASLVGG